MGRTVMHVCCECSWSGQRVQRFQPKPCPACTGNVLPWREKLQADLARSAIRGDFDCPIENPDPRPLWPNGQPPAVMEIRDYSGKLIQIYRPAPGRLKRRRRHR